MRILGDKEGTKMVLPSASTQDNELVLKAFASVVIHVIGPIMTHNMHLFLFIALLNYFLYIPKLAVTDGSFKYLD